MLKSGLGSAAVRMGSWLGSLCGLVNAGGTRLPVLQKRGLEDGQLLVGPETPEAFGHLEHAGGGPAQGHRFTFRQTCRIRAFNDSMMLVLASERRSSSGSLRRITVRVSSSPSRMFFETPGASNSIRRGGRRREAWDRSR